MGTMKNASAMLIRERQLKPSPKAAASQNLSELLKQLVSAKMQSEKLNYENVNQAIKYDGLRKWLIGYRKSLAGHPNVVNLSTAEKIVDWLLSFEPDHDFEREQPPAVRNDAFEDIVSTERSFFGDFS
jgi:hypothetical protein